MAEQHVAKWNKVWQKIGTKTPLKNTIELKHGEKITDYEQVPKPKEAATPTPIVTEPQNYTFTENKPKKGAF